MLYDLDKAYKETKEAIKDYTENVNSMITELKASDTPLNEYSFDEFLEGYHYYIGRLYIFNEMLPSDCEPLYDSLYEAHDLFLTYFNEY